MALTFQQDLDMSKHARKSRYIVSSIMRPHPGLAPIIFGILDGAAGFSYFFNSPILIWHLSILTLKLTAMFTLWRRIDFPSPLALAMVGSLLIIFVASMMAGTGAPTGSIAALAFMCEFILTTTVIQGAQYEEYSKGVACAVAASAGLHVLLVLTHHMASSWGRYMYFNNTQPNLGGEIGAMGAICATLSFKRMIALVIITIVLIDSLFLESRSATLSILGCILFIGVFDGRRQLKLGRAAFILWCFALIFVIKMLLSNSSDMLESGAGSIFHMDDKYRGISSGYSGRVDLWNIAWYLFLSSIYIGHGLGYYSTIGYLGPHNFFLYGLGEDGLSSVFISGCVVAGFLYALRRPKFEFGVLLCSVPLLFFNDRFINLNPYPFVLFVLLCTMGHRQTAPVRKSLSQRGAVGEISSTATPQTPSIGSAS